MLVVAGYQRSTVPAGQEDFDTEYNSLRYVVDLHSKTSCPFPARGNREGKQGQGRAPLALG
jgi:hypothetical protein